MPLSFKDGIYVNPYYTNWYYLQNMTELQVKILKGMEWRSGFQYIHDDLEEPVPYINIYTNGNYSVKYFISALNNVVKRL